MANSVIKFNNILRYRNNTSSSKTIKIPVDGVNGCYVIYAVFNSDGGFRDITTGQISVGGSWADYPVSVDSSLSDIFSNASYDGSVLTLTMRDFATAIFIKF